MQEEEANKVYADAYQLQTQRVFLTLKLWQAGTFGEDHWVKREIGTFEYNFYETFSQILERTADYLGRDPLLSENKIHKENI